MLDGWALVHAPGSPAAVHVWALLGQVLNGIELIVALPGNRPAWLPGSIASLSRLADPNPGERLAWAQRRLPTLARQVQADWLHTGIANTPFLSPIRRTISPVSYSGEQSGEGLADRLRASLGAGGAVQARHMLWPADLDNLPKSSQPLLCRPFVHPDYLAAASTGPDFPLALPETFVLYHGPGDEASLQRLAAAWSWAASSLGAEYPLLAVGLSTAARDRLKRLAIEYSFGATLQILPELPTSAYACLYKACSVLFHPAEIPPWGDPLLLAMACGKPVVAGAAPFVSQRAGPAAYLAPLEEPRTLGAALLTVSIEETLASDLGRRAAEQFSSLPGIEPSLALRELWPAENTRLTGGGR